MKTKNEPRNDLYQKPAAETVKFTTMQTIPVVHSVVEAIILLFLHLITFYNLPRKANGQQF